MLNIKFIYLRMVVNYKSKEGQATIDNNILFHLTILIEHYSIPGPSSFPLVVSVTLKSHFCLQAEICMSVDRTWTHMKILIALILTQ